MITHLVEVKIVDKDAFRVGDLEALSVLVDHLSGVIGDSLANRIRKASTKESSQGLQNVCI
jgi:hypothetical protein